MSRDTVSPSQGPGGPETELQRERRPFLSGAHDETDQPNESKNPGEATGSLSCGEGCGQGHVTGENILMDDLIRNQPQRLPPPDGALAPDPQGSPYAGLSNGNGVPPPGTTHTAAEPRKQPSPVSHKVQRKLQSSLSVSSGGSQRSKGSSTVSHKPGSSPEDCCVHCILACLFCEFLSLCNLVLAQASCGGCSSEACCCCCADDLGDDCNCPCDMDCGIMDACCESSDCLEICMECCGICFPT
ncbi:myoD family inhibitor domain-containing protein isoform X1 [Brienomyrus brachyistius]|uniref:myoD family inhibitor domain-containing protein isoform X1 n=1 Tax=Brienomyrus brachyistius TaxID=42636 RepID=UPI0020B2EFC2|nr:myoD family inhibitor domain-containing protein isoform X1 [Brienomyrus brachyistius]